VDELTELPEGWQATMRLQFEGAIPMDKKAAKPNQAGRPLSAFSAAVHWLFAHLLTLLCPLFFYRSSFRK